MLNKIKKYIKNNRGDTYISFLICITIAIPIFVFVFEASSAMTQKMWLDDRINDITNVVAITGDVSCEDVSLIENDIQDKMGGDFVYTSTAWVNPSKTPAEDGRVQLGGIVNVTYKNEQYPIIKISDDFILHIDIDLTRQSISEKYFKPD